jgi:spermidine synthase
VTQFSLVIGIFLSAMGLGSFLSKFIREDLIGRFLLVEVAVGLLGGFSALLLFAAFTYTETYSAVMVAVAAGVGTLIGLEIPLIIRILRDRQESLRLTVANVMTVDYVGALVASLAFPFLLVPHLGLMRAAFLTGLLNLGVGWLGLGFFRAEIARPGRLRATLIAGSLLLLGGAIGSEHLVTFLEERVYPDEIVYARQTRYQRLVITRWRDDTRLFIDGNLQFSSRDEHRYHESLVHPAMGMVPAPRRVLILGGGDGMAARECLKYPRLERVDLVDIDPEMTRIFSEVPLLAALNSNALKDPRVHVHNLDAMQYVKDDARSYDVILMDLPDPSGLSIGKLYTTSFFTLAARRLTPRGILAVQSSSPFFAAKAYWCIVNTLGAVAVPGKGEGARLNVLPYHANVPSFGVWGFVLASAEKLDPERASLKVPTRYLNKELMPRLFAFPADMARQQTEVNRLNSQVLVQYYSEGYRQFYD